MERVGGNKRLIMMKTMNKAILLLVFAGFVLTGGCDKNDTPEPGMELLALFFAISDYNEPEDNYHGILVIDANTMEVLNILKSDKYFNSIELSSDNKTWYVISSSYLDPDNFLLQAIDSKTGDVVEEVEVNNPKMALSKNSEVFVVYGGLNKGMQFVDKNTFEIIHEEDTYEIFQEDTLYANVKVADFSPSDKLYYGWRNKIFEYDINEFTITQEFPIQGEASHNLKLSDINISPDGKNIYVTTRYFSQGAFFSIEIASGKFNFYNAGYHSQIAVSPDGRHVYITDPAGLPNPYDTYPMPTNKVLRYDVKEETMETFIEGVDELGLTNGYIYTSYPHVGPDNKYLYMVLWSRKYTADGNPVDVVQVNIKTKRVVGFLELPENWRGWMVRDSKIGKYKTR